MTVEIICADAREALAAMPDGAIHACITSPPYWGLRDYGLEPVIWGGDDSCGHEWAAVGPAHHPGQVQDGKAVTNENAIGQNAGSGAFCRRCNAWRGTLGLEPTPELYVEHIVQVMREVRRVLRDDGTLWLNLGDSYGSGTRASRDYSRNVKHGYWQNPAIDKRIPAPAKQLLGMPWRVAFALQADGWWLRSDIVWSKPNPMPESVTDRPTRSHEFMFLLAKSARYYYDQDAIREPLDAASIARISQATFDEQSGGPKDYRASGINRHRSARQGLENLKEAHARGQGRNRRSVWSIATQPYPGAHFAVFPEKLVEPCILAGTSERGCCPECGAPWERVVERTGETARDRLNERGGVGYVDAHTNPQGLNHAGHRDASRESCTVGWHPTCDHDAEPVPCRVLDCFAGSGTVGLVAERLGRHSVLIDASEDYCRMARERTAQRGLMAGAP